MYLGLKDSMRTPCKNWELNLNKVPFDLLLNSTVLSGHREDEGHGQDPACTVSLLSDVSHNPVNDVNIGQNRQLPLFLSEWLDPSMDLPSGTLHTLSLLYTNTTWFRGK